MQGLSTRAHAFSVESLVRSCKMKDETVQCMSENYRDTPTGSVIDQRDERKNRRRKFCETRGKSNATKRKVAKEVVVDLQGSGLWKRFHEIGNEMIITKAGRRLFPSLRVKVHNLDPLQQYYIAMDIVPVDSKRYRYVYHSSQWMVAGNTCHSLIFPRLYVHPDSPCSGEKWMRQVVSFDSVKLTNNETDDKGHIILQSMHKYKLRIHVILHSPRVDLSQKHPSLPVDGVHTFSFPETQFTTVTAYQNQQITKLKIERNPFAKGFRDSGRNRGMLDGFLDSYPWRSQETDLDFKHFAMELQGRSSESSANLYITSTLKTLLPSSCSTAAHPLPSPQFCKVFPSDNLTYRAYCNLGMSSGYTGLQPLLDLPFMSSLQLKTGYSCKSHCLQDTTTTGLFMLPVPKIQASCVCGDYRAQNNTMPALIFPSMYSYSLPMSHQFSSATHQLKLGDGESPVQQMPINGINYCTRNIEWVNGRC